MCRPSIPVTLFRENEEASTAYEPPALDIDESGRVLLSSAQDLVTALSALLVAPPSAEAVTSAVARQAAWEAKTVQICSGASTWHAFHAANGSTATPAAFPAQRLQAAPQQQPPAVQRLTIHEIAAHIAAADQSRFSCERVEELRELLEAPAEALAGLRRTLTKRGVAQKMDRCIAIVSESARQSRGAMQRVLRMATGAAAPAGSAADVELNCLCQQVRSGPLPAASYPLLLELALPCAAPVQRVAIA